MTIIETEAQRQQGGQDDQAAADAAFTVAVDTVVGLVPGAEANRGAIVGRFMDLPDDQKTPANLHQIAQEYATDPGQQAPAPRVTGGAPAMRTTPAAPSELAEELRDIIARRDMGAFSKFKAEHPEISVRRRLTGDTNYRQPQ